MTGVHVDMETKDRRYDVHLDLSIQEVMILHTLIRRFRFDDFTLEEYESIRLDLQHTMSAMWLAIRAKEDEYKAIMAAEGDRMMPRSNRGPAEKSMLDDF